jgi:Alw26I/Eco31I/Esp3I family type II restriction m6 adenine DNA methyltransferase
MVYDSLSEEERKSLELILGDLRLLIGKDRISVSEIDDIRQKLKSEDAKHYVDSLINGSKPEQALREYFLARNSPLAKYLFREVSPEVKTTHDEARGFIDYVIKDEDTGRTIRLELKALFEAKFETGKTRELKELRQVPLNPDAHSKQVQKYLLDENAQYVILTNLKDWYFYSKMSFPNVKPFANLALDQLLQRLETIGNIFELLVRLEHESVKEELDERFFEDLKRWVGELSKVQFEGDEKTKLELIITLINKFIFIQTLDDYGVIQFNWIKNTWDHFNERWRSKGPEEVIKKFLDEVDEWFYSYYDTELFKTTIFNYVKKTPENIQVFYDALKKVLGFVESQMRGITHYNFRHIDEDIFGRAYETFLAEARKEKGIYYTPKYITQYIVDNTVGKIFDEALEEVKSKLESGRLDEALESIKKFTSIKVLDPACGSGSFLIKAFRVIVEKYRRLGDLIDKAKEKIGGWKTLDPRSREPVEKLEELKKSLGLNNDIVLFTKILLRHIYGVDLDERAVKVAKVNLWLEAIKLSPKSFRYDKLGNMTHVLPNLDLNLRVGDSLVGYAGEAELVLKTLSTSYNSDLLEISTLRSKYIEDLGSTDCVDEIKKTMESLRKTLDDTFKKHLEGEKIPTEILNQTKPLHWIIDFWHAFFDEKGNPLPPELRGFHVIIGNPPYGRIKQLIKDKTVKDAFSKYYDSAYEYQRGNYNYYKLFLERSYKLQRRGGYFSMIFPSSFLGEEDSQPLRKLFFENAQVIRILEFPESTEVFGEKATQAVTVIVYRKEKPSPDHAVEIRTNIAKEELTKLSQLDFIKVKVEDIKRFTGENYRIPMFTNPREELPILEKISKIPPFKGGGEVPRVGEVYVGHLDETIDKEFLSEKPTGDLVVKGIHVDQYFVNLDPEGPQPRWVRKKDFLKKKPVAERYIQYERIIGRNVINKELRPRLKFTILQPGILVTNNVKFIVLTDNKLDKYYVVALLNSSLLNWRFELFSIQNRVSNYDIEELPFYRADPATQKAVSDIAKGIIGLKQARYVWFKLWRRASSSLTRDKLSLYEVLERDRDAIRTGELDKAWTSYATSYPVNGEQLPEMDRKYWGFMVKGDTRTNTIKIYGLEKTGFEDPVYELEFRSRELMLHTYSSLVNTLESEDVRVETLRDLLKKTIVPVVSGGRFLGELTQNIVRKAIEDFKKWLESEKIQGVDPDIVVIDSEIEDLVARVDAYVFKLYGLTSDEAKTILKSLGKPQSYIEKTLRYYTGL